MWLSAGNNSYNRIGQVYLAGRSGWGLLAVIDVWWCLESWLKRSDSTVWDRLGRGWPGDGERRLQWGSLGFQCHKIKPSVTAQVQSAVIAKLIYFSFKLKKIYLFLAVGDKCQCMCTEVREKLIMSVLFCHIDPGNWIQVIRLSNKCLYPLNHLTSLLFFF